jgi:translation initiation factor 1 (eIF-1/SUI1)
VCVRRVSGIEQFGVDAFLFAKEAQKMFACATITQTVPANAKHKAFEEVLIQGNVCAEMGAKLQQNYGIPANCVKILAKKKY